MEGGHPDENQKRAIQAGIEAERLFKEYAPEFLAVLKSVWLEMKRHRASNGGILAPELAVQLWYKVDAEFELERRFTKKVEQGAVAATKAAASAHPK